MRQYERVETGYPPGAKRAHDGMGAMIYAVHSITGGTRRRSCIDQKPPAPGRSHGDRVTLTHIDHDEFEGAPPLHPEYHGPGDGGSRYVQGDQTSPSGPTDARPTRQDRSRADTGHPSDDAGPTRPEAYSGPTSHRLADDEEQVEDDGNAVREKRR